jgi:hypothetical protein
MGRPGKANVVGKLPALFGTSEATEFLTLLCANEPLDLVEMSELSSSGHMALSKIARRLAGFGLITRCSGIGDSWSHLSKPYVLNKRYPAARELRALLISLAAAYRVRGLWRQGDYAIKRSRTAQRDIRYERLFGQRKRTLAIVLIYAVGIADCSLLFGYANHAANRRTLEDIVKYELLRSFRLGRHTVYTLNEEFPAAEELRHLLRRVVRLNPLFQGLAASLEMKRRTDPGRWRQVEFLRDNNIRDIVF